MAESAREYLMHRFRGDAQSLRERVAALQRGTSLPGPDAGTSLRMAEACDEVVRLLEALAPHDDGDAELAAIVSLVPLLDERAKASAASPPVRAVYAGAATRIREVQAAEARADGQNAHTVPDASNEDAPENHGEHEAEDGDA